MTKICRRVGWVEVFEAHHGLVRAAQLMMGFATPQLQTRHARPGLDPRIVAGTAS
jgi:hypothetical protein